jgi:hypothetical protein
MTRSRSSDRLLVNGGVQTGIGEYNRGTDSASVGLGLKMLRWLRIAVEFIRTLVGHGDGRSQLNPSSETENSAPAKDPTASADDVPIRTESQISGATESLPNQREIERRRQTVRRLFNDFWTSAEYKPATFAERLNHAEGYINDRLVACGEAWRLDEVTRKQLGLPLSKTRLD